jgi:nicotinate-nucleotide adenylyltransferase
VLGGTFNPIHYGHLVAADEVREAFALDSVIFVPAAIPPHKNRAGLIEPQHRLMMTTLATLSNPRFAVSTVEIDRPGASYSVETVAALKDQHPQCQAWYFILGIDAFVDLASWKQPDVLLKSCHTVVIPRPGYHLRELAMPPLQQLAAAYPCLSFGPPEHDTVARTSWVRVSDTPYAIYFHEFPALDISSTRIRQRIREGKSIAYLVPESVQAYICKYRLYR